MPVKDLKEAIDKMIKETGKDLAQKISSYVTCIDEFIKVAESHNEYLYANKEDIQKEGRFDFQSLITSPRKIKKLKIIRRRLKYMRTRAEKL